MADKKKNPLADKKAKPSNSNATQAPHPDEVDLATADLATFAEEYDSDNRMLRNALIVAGIFHAILLVIHFPSLSADFKGEDQKQKVYVVQQVRFKQPPPKQEQEIPQRKKKRVPIPDPTPDEPEPIRIEDEQPVIDLPDTDLAWDIPEGPPPVDDGPMIVAGDVVPPVRVFDPPPVYTEMARKARVQGVVIVQAIIDTEGNVTNVKVLKGLPMGLDQSAVNAVKSWRFRPATLNGRPVTVYYNLTVNFQIQ